MQEELREEFPEVTEMWVRDLRVIARTVLRRRGVAPEVCRRFLGHAVADVDAGYDRVDAGDLRAAAEALAGFVNGESVNSGTESEAV